MNDKVTILLATAGERINGLIYQINACLNQSYKDIELVVLVKNEAHKIVSEAIKVSDQRMTVVYLPEECDAGYGVKAIAWAIENLNLGKWLYLTGDDDVLCEWGIEELVKHSEIVEMVVGLCIPLMRSGNRLSGEPFGKIMQRGNVTGSCCLFKVEMVKKLGWPDEHQASDWFLIEKFLGYPFKQIDSVIAIMPTF